MPDDVGIYGLTKDDVEWIKRFRRAEQSRQETTTQRPAVTVDSLYVDPNATPEVYIGYTPPSGISGLSSTGTGTGTEIATTLSGADCQIYKVEQNSNAVIPIGGLFKTVYNLSTGAIAGNTWILAQRDKGGRWIVTSAADGTVTPNTFGCHFAVTGTLVELDLGAIAGEGIGVYIPTGTDSCPQLTVFVGDGIDFDPYGGLTLLVDCGLSFTQYGALTLDLSDVVFDGLYWSDEACALGINFACHLKLYPAGDDGFEFIGIDVEALAGVREETALTTIAGDYVGNGTAEANRCDILSVDMVTETTTTETIVNDTQTYIVGYRYLVTEVTKTIYTNHFNAAGLYINRTAGDPETTTSIEDLCTLCIITGTGTGSGDEFDEGPCIETCDECEPTMSAFWLLEIAAEEIVLGHPVGSGCIFLSADFNWILFRPGAAHTSWYLYDGDNDRLWVSDGDLVCCDDTTFTPENVLDPVATISPLPPVPDNPCCPEGTGTGTGTGCATPKTSGCCDDLPANLVAVLTSSCPASISGTYPLVEGLGTWTYTRDGMITGPGLTSLELSCPAGTYILVGQGICADGITPFGFTINGTVTCCSPFDFIGSTSVWTGCCNGTLVTATVTD